jgi:hypothetical protein
MDGVKVKTGVTLAAGTPATQTTVYVINPHVSNTDTSIPIHVAYFGYWTPANEAEADAIVAELQTKAPADVTTATPVLEESFVSGAGSADFVGSGITFDAADNPLAGGGGSLLPPVVIVV